VIATRGGKITDESDSDESDDEECANAFWLCLVVQKCQVADKDMTILNSIEKNLNVLRKKAQ
jgi:hypothetical protein